MTAFLLFLFHPKENLASATVSPTITPIFYRLTIPAISLETDVVLTGLNRQKLQEVPDKIVGLYKFGAKPGERGTAILVGHTPGIFSGLTSLKSGDKIYIGADAYQVNKTVIYQTASFPTKEIYGAKGGINLNLITCHGATKRLVIFSNKTPTAN